MEGNADFDNILKSLRVLPTIDKLKLIKMLSVEIEFDLKAVGEKKRKSLRGLWHDLGITNDEISQIRKEHDSCFPRSDI